MIEVREYLYEDGDSPFQDWFNRLDTAAAVKVTVYLTRMSKGNLSSIKGIGSGISECRIDWGPGYRIYLGQDGPELIILLGGGTKKRQNQDIKTAKSLWQEYKRRKKEDKNADNTRF